MTLFIDDIAEQIDFYKAKRVTVGLHQFERIVRDIEDVERRPVREMGYDEAGSLFNCTLVVDARLTGVRFD